MLAVNGFQTILDIECLSKDATEGIAEIFGLNADDIENGEHGFPAPHTLDDEPFWVFYEVQDWARERVESLTQSVEA